MSKQIAQTVGDKRIGALLAILAAFAVLATLATQWQKSDAIDETTIVYDVEQVPAGGATTTVLQGSAVTYQVTTTAPVANLVNEVLFDFDYQPGLTYVSVTPVSPTIVTCTNNSPAAGIVRCSLNSLSLGANVDFTLNFTATSTFTSVAGDVDGFRAGAADLSNDDTAAADTITGFGLVTVVDMANQFAKTHAASVPQGGGNLVYTLTYNNPANFSVAAGGLDFDDTINPVAGATVTSIVPSANMSCNISGVGLNQPVPVALHCDNPAIINTAVAATVVITVAIPANNTVGQPDQAAPTRNLCNTATGTLTVGAISDAFTSEPTCATQVGLAADNGNVADLVHLQYNAGLTLPAPIFADRDRENNVIGFLHRVCATNRYVDSVWPNTSDSIEQSADLAGANQSDNFRITTISGTATVEGPFVQTLVDCDGDLFEDDSVVTWYSTSTGEQDIVVVNDGGNTVLDSEGTTAPYTVPLVKEWNTLSPTWIMSSSAGPIQQAGTGTPPLAADALAGTNLDKGTVNGTTVFNAALGVYQGASSTYYEFPIATHANAAGTQLYIAYGATVTITRGASTCGAVHLGGTNGVEYVLESAPNGTVLDSTFDATLNPNEKIVLTSLGVGIPFSFSAHNGAENDCTNPTGSTSVNIQVSYPILLGSDNPANPPLETLTINWSGTVAAKQVFLAWAGQRIILEHDWRLPAGDVDGGSGDLDPDPVANSVCIYASSFQVQHIRGSGPGNFLQGLGAAVSGNDQAIVTVNSHDPGDNSQSDEADATNDNPNTDSDDDIISDPQDSCISRVLYESEDQGQVDIEAFVIDAGGNGFLNATKIAFVIYYMKINTVEVSLVTQVEKPSHNSSALADYSPGNPWDATKDDADNAAEWNVSKDLLVRGRVTGWFTTSNPSGRAADTTNPLNILPANRWVMPDDWSALAGGPLDVGGLDEPAHPKGTAEAFRQYYDIMFAPNNERGIVLANPEGTSTTQVATTLAATANAVNSTTLVAGLTVHGLAVTNCTDLTAGVKVNIGSAGAFTVVACSSNFLIVSTAGNTTNLTSIPAAGTVVSIVSGAPFEGPYSTLDILGLAGQGLGGAALSEWDDNNIRDTALDDGDVDSWDAPMPAAPVSVAIRGTGFIKQVIKSDVYWNGTVNSAAQSYPNPYYIQDIPASPFIPAVAAGGGYFWDSWSNDGPGGLGQDVYRFWVPAIIGTNSAGVPDTFTAAQTLELAVIRGAYDTNLADAVITPDNTIARDLVIYSDNHGEFMVTANGDYRTDLAACATNVLAGGKHCKTGDKVGTGSITATVDYPDFRGKHFPVLSNTATVTWTWGGYKDVTVEAGETDQFKYIVFHALDRDGFCSPTKKTGAVLLHPVLSATDALNNFGYTGNPYNGDPNEYVDFLIDSGEGIIIETSPLAADGKVNDGKQFATGVFTFSTLENTTIKEFPLSPLAAAGQDDECQAWIKVSNSLLGILNILAIAHDDEGNIGFDKIIDLTNTTSYTLNFRWSLITWAGADAITVSDAIKGTGTSGKNPGGNDISASVTAIYGWDAAAQQWLGYFPSGVNVPGANDLTTLETGQAYWIAITGPSSVTWTIASNVN